MKKVIVVTGASSGFGALAARALAKAGHVVYASMRDTSGRNRGQVQEAAKFAADNKADLRTVELDVLSDTSVNAAITKIIEANGRLDVVVHNGGHMVFGPLEAFTPEQLEELYDVNVLSTQRVNRAALPPVAEAKAGIGGLGIEQQFGRWYSSLPCTVFCSEGKDGCAGGGVGARAHPLGYRDVDRGSRCVHRRNKPF